MRTSFGPYFSRALVWGDYYNAVQSPSSRESSTSALLNRLALQAVLLLLATITTNAALVGAA